jgi:hypothetical protein
MRRKLIIKYILAATSNCIQASGVSGEMQIMALEDQPDFPRFNAVSAGLV